MRIRLTAMLILQLFSINVYSASEPLQQIKIAEPYIEMHTGPGSGYPVFHVMERGSLVEIIVKQADWFKIRNQKGQQGWVSFDEISRTLAANGDAVEFAEITQEDFAMRNWEWGVMGGEFGGAPVISPYAAYMFNEGLSAEISVSHIIGSVSSDILYKLGLVMQPFSEWKYSPFFQLGVGLIDVTATGVQPVDNVNQLVNISLGVRTHLTQKIILRLEYTEYVLFSATRNNQNNEEIKEWKAGFAVFF